jgi:hypothetical protein
LFYNIYKNIQSEKNFLFKLSNFEIYKLKIKTKMQHIENLDRLWVASLLAEGYNTYDIVKNYDLSEDVILDSHDLLDKEVLIQGINFTENFVEMALEIEYFSTDDLKNLSMTTYSNLSKKFLHKHREFLNWTKLLIWVSTQTDSFADYVEIIQENNLWDLISANNLPIDFIREYKDKLNWNFLSIIKEFSEEEKLEFTDYIIEKNREVTDDDFKTVSSIIPNFNEDLSVDDISELIDKIQERYN